MRLDVEYDFVAIIDCLSEKERSKWNLANDLMDYLAYLGIEQEQSKCDNKKMFLSSMKYFLTRASNGEKFCMHIISHGNKNGIGFKNPIKMILWDEFRKFLYNVNGAMGGKFIVNMTSCFGLHGIKIIDLSLSNFPFFGLVGPSIKIGFKEVKELNKLFYLKQTEGKGIPKVISELNKENGKELLYSITSQGYQTIINATNTQV